MNDPIQTYLRKRAIREPWNIAPSPDQTFRYLLVVPAFAERDYLPGLLASIEKQSAKLLTQTAVIIVVNNGASSEDGVRRNNHATLDYLKSRDRSFFLGVVDAASPGLAIPDKWAGVGMARKIGLDIALKFAAPEALLFSTDADCILVENYLQHIRSTHAELRWQAAVVGFSHRRSDDPMLAAAISEYEHFLITTAEKMHAAGSIYGYPAVGSTIVTTAAAYASVGGMPRRKATEDFYFLQELAKFCGVTWIREILVHPSARAERRVHLGTGFRMAQARAGLQLSSLQYRDEAFEVLGAWLELGRSSRGNSADTVLECCGPIHPRLAGFLVSEKIKAVWQGLQQSSPTERHFIQQFDRWFDGLKTIRLLKVFST